MIAHPFLFPTGKFGYTYKRREIISPCNYFNQRLLNYTQKFASDPDYIFYAQSVTQHINLNSCINIAIKKIKADGLTAGRVSQNFKETVSGLIANDDAYNFMNQLKGTPAYWKRFLLEVLAMVKQLGLPTYFMTLSCAYLRWNELVDIIQKLKGEEMTEEEIENMNYMERTSALQSNPVLLARHFQYRVENFFKYIVMDGSLGKVAHYAIRVEFQGRGSPHIHSLIWVENAPKLSSDNITEYSNFVKNSVKCELPEHNTALFNLVKTYQTHYFSKWFRKYKSIDCRYSFGNYFCNETIIVVPLSNDLANDEKENVLNTRKQFLGKVKGYIDQNLDPKHNNTGLLAWEANIDIQPVLDYYKAVAYMCAYPSKSEDESTEAMKQAAKEAYENGKTIQERIKSISKSNVNSRSRFNSIARNLAP